MSAKVKAEQLKATGATVLATACENCHSQLTDVNEHYQLGMDVQFISGLVADALVNADASSKTEPNVVRSSQPWDNLLSMPAGGTLFLRLLPFLWGAAASPPLPSQALCALRS